MIDNDLSIGSPISDLIDWPRRVLGIFLEPSRKHVFRASNSKIMKNTESKIKIIEKNYWLLIHTLICIIRDEPLFFWRWVMRNLQAQTIFFSATSTQTTFFSDNGFANNIFSTKCNALL